MFTLKKSPLNKKIQNYSPNPFDSDDDSGNKKTINPSQRTSSEPTLVTPNFSTNPSDDDNGTQTTLPSYSVFSSARNKYKNDFRDSGGLENQTVQELENYAVYKAEETTKTVNSCLKIAEDIREDANKTLVTLHQQGEQITRTHMAAADMDHDLSRGEKLLGSLGGIFSKKWKPTRSRPIKGPVMTKDDPAQRRGNPEQREKLGLTPPPKGRSHTRTQPSETTNAYQKVEVQHAKQDDALSDLSNLLEELKDMAVDMGSEIDRQNKALNPLMDDVDELNFRVKGANQRGRRLLGK